MQRQAGKVTKHGSSLHRQSRSTMSAAGAGKAVFGAWDDGPQVHAWFQGRFTCSVTAVRGSEGCRRCLPSRWQELRVWWGSPRTSQALHHFFPPACHHQHHQPPGLVCTHTHAGAWGSRGASWAGQGHACGAQLHGGACNRDAGTGGAGAH